MNSYDDLACMILGTEIPLLLPPQSFEHVGGLSTEADSQLCVEVLKRIPGISRDEWNRMSMDERLPYLREVALQMAVKPLELVVTADQIAFISRPQPTKKTIQSSHVLDGLGVGENGTELRYSYVAVVARWQRTKWQPLPNEDDARRILEGYSKPKRQRTTKKPPESSSER